MTHSKTHGKANIIWRFFSSVKLTIFLLIVLALTSILGTLIPQREDAIQFIRTLNPELLQILSSLNMFDMYHSLWFRLLMGCLVVNLVVCSIHRFPATWKKARTMPRPDREKPFEHLPAEQTFMIQGEIKGISNSVGQFLQRCYKKVQKKETPDNYFFHVERGRYSNFGVYLVHLSVLLILIGGLTGSFIGFEAYVNILEGEQVGVVSIRKGMLPLSLGFEVRCNKFTVDFYKDNSPREYRSELSFLAKGKKPENKTLIVNHPVHFRGITFYQANYGTMPGKKVRIRISRDGKQDGTTIEVETGKPSPLPDGEGHFYIEKVNENLMGMMGPAVLISIQPNHGEEIHFWAFKNYKTIRERFPGLMDKSQRFDASSFKPYTFFLDSLESRYFTGLQVNKDPGVSIVWFGCLLMIGGFIVTFFTSHIRIWVKVTTYRRGVNISVAGTASKNHVGLQRHLEHLSNNLKNLFEKGS